jgi:hypothetical protein
MNTTPNNLTQTRTRDWTVTTNAGRVVDIATTEHGIYGGARVADKVIEVVNADLDAGIASPDVSTWAFACPQRGDGGGFYWVSYLSFVWNVVSDRLDGATFDEEKRVQFARALRETVEWGIAHDWPAERMLR